MALETKMMNTQLLDLTHVDFKKVVIESKQAFLIQVQADWCGECFLMQPILKKLALEFKTRLMCGYINIDLNETITKQYGVTELPFILFFNHGQLVDHLIGLQSQKTLIRYAEKLIQYQPQSGGDGAQQTSLG